MIEFPLHIFASSFPFFFSFLEIWLISIELVRIIKKRMKMKLLHCANNHRYDDAGGRSETKVMDSWTWKIHIWCLTLCKKKKLLFQIFITELRNWNDAGVHAFMMMASIVMAWHKLGRGWKLTWNFDINVRKWILYGDLFGFFDEFCLFYGWKYRQ